MSSKVSTTEKRVRRHKKIRTRVMGTEARPRLSVSKSHQYIRVQLIDDAAQKTIAAGHTGECKGDTMSAKARDLGTLIAKRAGEKKITAVVFDRGGYKFTGNIRALAEGAREAGLTF